LPVYQFHPTLRWITGIEKVVRVRIAMNQGYSLSPNQAFSPLNGSGRNDSLQNRPLFPGEALSSKRHKLSQFGPGIILSDFTQLFNNCRHNFGGRLKRLSHFQAGLFSLSQGF
jgi:hypothetical protein